MYMFKVNTLIATDIFLNKNVINTRPAFKRARAFYVIVIYDLQKMAALLIGLID